MAAKDYFELTDRGRAMRLRAVAIRALEKYDLNVVRIRAMTDATNGIFRLDSSDGSRYAMRVGLGPPAGHTKGEMRSEAEWIASLIEQPNVQVPAVIAARDESQVVTAAAEGVPHERPCVVFSWLEGPLLADRIDQHNFELYGAAMADLHVAALSFAPSPEFTAPRYDKVYPYDLPFVVFSDAGDDLLPPKREAVFRQGYDIVDKTFSGLSTTGPMRMIHGDMHGWNVKINRGRIAVFDFEDMVWGWPIQDIGVAMYYYWRRDDFDSLVEAFRRGYETVAPWPGRDGDLWSVLIARSLLMANDVIQQPEWIDEAPTIYELGEKRITDMLRRLK
ncbi:MAG: phosphotransferase enzyme family protein [Acidimicrobiia bacterium]